MNDLPEIRGKYRQNSQVTTWFNTSGKADLIFIPEDVEDLMFFLKKNTIKDIYVIGVGSNTLVRDSGVSGVVIRLGRGFNYINHNGLQITSGAASLDLNVALYSSDHEIGGLEFLSGIPGTIGGAIAMNAGAYGSEIKDVFISAKGVTLDGDLVEISGSDIEFYYRKTITKKPIIFTEVVLCGKKDDNKIIKEKISKIQNERQLTQPVKSKTGGSTFKNPTNQSAWKLIDEAGCRGLKIGGAMVSQMHCNFIINDGSATSEDIENLINIVKQRVFDKFGVALEEEIKIIGNK